VTTREQGACWVSTTVFDCEAQREAVGPAGFIAADTGCRMQGLASVMQPCVHFLCCELAPVAGVWSELQSHWQPWERCRASRSLACTRTQAIKSALLRAL
jgi:hypothetical protein